MFTSQDKKAYKSYLSSQIAKEQAKEESIARAFNLNNLYSDLNGLK